MGRVLLDSTVLIDALRGRPAGNPDDFPMPGITVEHWPVGR
jgi:hypothetical protein